MTPSEINAAIAAATGRTQRFHLIKRGLYWRPNSAGYTSEIECAGIYTEEEARKRVSGRNDDPDRVTMEKVAPPDYFGDLNALHAAWETLADAEKHGFRSMVAHFADVHGIWYEEAWKIHGAKIFLRVVGKWEDRP